MLERRERVTDQIRDSHLSPLSVPYVNAFLEDVLTSVANCELLIFVSLIIVVFNALFGEVQHVKYRVWTG